MLMLAVAHLDWKSCMMVEDQPASAVIALFTVYRT